MEQEAAGTPWYRRRWLVVALTAVIVLLVATAATALVAYVVWLASPEKALSDAVRYAATNPAVYRVTAAGKDITLRSDGELQQATGTYDGIEFEAIHSKSTLYIKPATPERLLDKFAISDQFSAQLRPIVDTLAATIRNKWVAIRTSDIPQTATDAHLMPCIANGNMQLMASDTARQQLATAYVQHRFVVADRTASTSNEVTYALSIDGSKLRGFLDALVKTDFYKSHAWQCDDSVQKLRDMSTDTLRVTAALDRSNNRFTAIDIGDKPGSAVKIAVDYTPVAKITLPADALSYDALKSNVAQTLFKSFLQSR